MRLNAGILITKLSETKTFYTQLLDFKIKFENDFYLLLQTPNGKDSLSFLLPNHPTQHPMFHDAFAGKGMYLTVEVNNVDALYARLQQKNAPIKDEDWGKRHFAIQDPNGIGIDFVTYTEPK
ncbi:VOC family protein [Aquimarina agarivorans]|uniref:VOC family protein n=1 Tax=Aquimarina agarivorans TaxID=980584 RepID=UPI000248F01E|nr:VOC family protein [Aquimarina agarivorans]